MALSPQDIHNKEFSVKMRGYNIDQVNDFLDQIVKDYQRTLIENKSLKKNLRDASNKVNYYDNLRNSLNQSILVAQEAANKVKIHTANEAKANQQKAKKQISQLLDQGKKKANQIIQKSVQKANRLMVETSDLRKSTNEFRDKIQTMFKSQLALVQSNQWSTVFNGDHKSKLQKLSKDINHLSNSQSSKRDKVIVYYPDGKQSGL